MLMMHAVPLSKRDRIAFRTGPKILANSLPKAGTHLLSQLLCQIPNISPRWTYHFEETGPRARRQLSAVGKGRIVLAHLPWSEELVAQLNAEDFRVLLIVRDGRDIAVSSCYYACSNKYHIMHNYVTSLDSDSEKLKAAIAEPPECFPPGFLEKNVLRPVEAFLPWLDEPCCLTVRFEDLIGVRGGGDRDKQLDTIAAIMRHVGADFSYEQIEKIADRTFSSSAKTFRKGEIGDWRRHFKQEHKDLFKKLHGDALIRLGYEADDNW